MTAESASGLSRSPVLYSAPNVGVSVHLPADLRSESAEFFLIFFLKGGSLHEYAEVESF